MSTLQFIAELNKKGIELWVEDGNRLRFMADKGLMTDEVKAGLRARKQEIIDLLNQAADLKQTAQTTIQPRPADVEPPLSYAQERLWFVEQLEPENGVFLMPQAVDLKGDLQPELLERALQTVIQRHESLRSAFIERDGFPRLVIQDTLDWSLDKEDLSELPETERQAALSQTAVAFAGKLFDLTQAPLFRACLVRLNAQRHILLFNMHHIISDGWSLGVFSAEWQACYKALAAGAQPELPPLPIQYADYAYHQRQALTDEVLAKQAAWWRQNLQGVSLLEFPVDRPRPAKQTYGGATLSFELDAELLTGLKTLASKEGASLYMILLAAFQTLMFRYTGQTDIAVGSSIGNRNHAEIEGLIGLFVNLLCMRGDLSGNPSFRELLTRTRTRALDVFAHQDLPFEKVVEACRVERDLSRHPLFQIQLVLVGASGDGETPDDLQVEAYDWGGGTVSRQDITVIFTEHKAGLWGLVEYNTDLFDAGSMERLTRHFHTLLRAAVRTPEKRLSDLPMLDAAEREQLADWNRVDRPFPIEATIPALFEAQVAAHGDQIALSDGLVEMTYTELNARANKIANHLIDLGVESESMVGFCLEPGPDMVVVLLAILKADGVYVPLDPQYPQQRLSFLIEDTAPSVVITNGELIESLPAYDLNFINVLMLDEDADMIDATSDENPAPRGAAQNLAYVVYTSGTTGKPKGVQVTHRNVLRLIYDHQYLCLEPGDGVTQASNISFDALTFEVWTALLHGARLCLVDKQSFINPETFAQTIIERGINVLFTTTALFNQFARNTPTIFARMKYVLFGGELVDPYAARTILEQGPPQHLLHVYGPTESTTFATWFPIKNVPVGAHNIPIGGPIANTFIHVLDPSLNQVPVGVDGEVMIGGHGLARGYLNRPDLTAEKFIPDPYATEPGGRLYRTGDLCRRNQAGALEFRGRVDHQVKIRGFRIELDEIEATLLEHGAVDLTVVLVKSYGTEATGISKKLVAYIQVASDLVDEGYNGDDLKEDLRRYLKENLPDYMIPSGMVLLDKLPLNPNGKIDRRALPEPDAEGQGDARAYVAPETEQEKMLAEIWREVIGVERVGLNDNFFELGGDSLLSIQIKAQSARRGLNFELHTLFEYPTIAQILRQVVSADTEETTHEPFALISEEDRALLPEGVEDAYPVSGLQAGMLFHHAFEHGAREYHEVVCYEVALTFDQGVLQRCLDLLTARNANLRTCFDLDRYSMPMQLVLADVTMPLTVFDLRQSTDQEAELAAWLDREIHRAMDWRTPPLLHSFAFRLDENRFQISFSFHHAIIDGWSEATLFSTFLRTYTAMLENRDPAPPEPQPHYREFIALELAALNNPESRAYWRNQLTDADGLLLTGDERELHHGNQGHQVIEISPDLSSALHALVGDTGLPVKDVFLAAHMKALTLISGRHALITGLVANGRPELVGSEQTMGLFLNTVPFRFDLTAGSWRDLIAHVFELEKQLLPHRRFPLPEIIRQGPGGRPFDTAFNFTHFHVRGGSHAQSNQVLSRGGFAKASFPMVTNFQIQTDTNRILAQLDYDDAYLDPATAARYADLYLRVLTAMAADPNAAHHVNLLGEAETRCLAQLNQTAAPYPAHHTMPDLFREVVARHGNADALLHTDGALTYAQLDAASDQLAAWLQTQGAGPETVIAISVESRPELIIGLIAIIKAGSVYLPLDPTLPPDRLAFMLEDSRVPLVLTHADRAHLFGQTPLFLFDQHQDRLAGFTTPTKVSLDPQNTALINYTSGTTGLPKGVRLSHRNVLRLVCDTNYLTVAPGTGFTQGANPAFDAFTYETWTPLLHGGRLGLVPKDDFVDPARLAGYLKRWQIKVVFATTALLNTFARTQPDLFNHLDFLMFGGQKAEPGAIRAILNAGGPDQILHFYGPTESTTYATWYPVTQVVEDAVHVPIGGPIANTRAYLLDPLGVPVPVGAVGELYIAGPGLARGYQNRAGLTASVFVPDPFATQAEPGGRLYRTGDLMRFRPDHTGQPQLEFIGRVDHQVKLRGLRIELGEIEARLKGHPAVSEAVVLVIGAAGQERLAAWLVLEPGTAAVPATELRTHLGRFLPDYMIPNSFTTLDAFPINARGKLDQNALPMPESGADEGHYAPPQTPMEEIIAAQWATLLAADRIGRRDNFFELGGHSLSATQVISRVREALGLELPVRVLFQHPVLQDFAAQLEAHARAEGSQPLPPIEAQHAPPGTPLPLSYAQERLWFLNRLQPGAAYNIPMALRLRGPLDVARLQRCFDTLSQRHDALRTRFGQVKGAAEMEAAQFVDAFQPMDLTPVSLSDETELRDMVNTEALKTFDLETGPLWRLQLYRMGADDHVLFLNMHHIITDGWSLKVMLGELCLLYAADAEGQPAQLPPLELQYPDFAAWQRTHMDAAYLEDQLAWWENRLSGVQPLELPLDFPRPALQTDPGRHHHFTVPAEVSTALQTQCRAWGATPFMWMAGAFSLLLSRYADQTDLSMGTTIANRNRAQLEDLIGFFVNTLVMRFDLADPDLNFKTLTQQVRRTALDAYAHQDVPFERVVERLHPKREMSRSPLFQVFMSLENLGFESGDNALALPGLTLEQQAFDYQIAKFDLSLYLTQRGDQLVGAFEYNTDLFKPETITRLTGHFLELMSQLATAPEARLAHLSIMGQDERRRLLVDFNATAVDHPAACLHQMFEARAARTPEAVALHDGDQTWTYDALNQAANRLAHELIARGVTLETPVGVSLPNSAAVVIAQLAILKAGGAWLPLDPTYPAERLAYIAENSGAALVLTDASVAPQFTASQNLTLLNLADLDLSQRASHNPAVPVQPENTAYVVYTSGSTGYPKGVPGHHRGAVNRLHWMWRALPYTDGETACRHVSLNFVDSVWELFAPLLQGVPIHVVPDTARGVPEKLLDLLSQARVTRVVMVPSLLRALLDLDHDTRQHLPHTWVTSGETLPAELATAFYRTFPNARLINLYGQSEMAGDITWQPVAKTETNAAVPIGTPLDNCRVYVLDRRLQPVPVGLPSELYLGGVQMVRGYLGAPALTAASFLPAPFGDEPGARLYRSGDRVRFLPDGNLQFLGRVDHQIKIRGQRVELGEIETALRDAPGVDDAVVLVDHTGHGRLVAYLQTEEDLDRHDLRAFLKQRLPDHMNPAAFHQMTAFPLTPNGKLNRAALPDPSTVHEAREHISPRTPLERDLTQIWSQLLNRDDLSIRDDFFAAGGHSLLATRLVSRMRNLLGVEPALRDIFNHPTIEAQAALVQSMERDTLVEPPRAETRPEHLPLAPAQQRLWVLNRLEPNSRAYQMPLLFQLDGNLDRNALTAALAALIQRHESLRTFFGEHQGEPVQRIQNNVDAPLTFLDLSDLDPKARDEAQAKHIQADIDAGFDLERGPLFRVLLLRLSQTRHMLLLHLHHIITDGWSNGILLDELAQLYENQVSGGEDLPPLPLQYADYTLWQRRQLERRGEQAHLDWWASQLADTPPFLELPLDFPRPAEQTFNGANLAFHLPAQQAAAVNALCVRLGVTPFMFFGTLYALLLARFSGQSRVNLGTPTANRDHAQLEPLIGFFVNTVVLCFDFETDSANHSLTRLLDRTKDLVLETFAHGQIPFERVVERVQPKRELNRSPLFQAFFSLMQFEADDSRRGHAHFKSLDLSPVDGGQVVSRFELSLNMIPREGGYDGAFEYNTDLFKPATIQRLADHLHHLITRLVEAADQHPATLDLLPGQERELLLKTKNQTRVAFEDTGFLHQEIAATTARFPQRTAVTFDDESGERHQLTYAQLDHRATLFAQHLQALGVSTETPVAVCLPRSLDLVIVLLGVLKSGGAYIPLDPNHPTERLNLILEDSRADVLVTDSQNDGLMGPTTRIVPDWKALESSNPGVLSNLVLHPQQAAYTIFTSGSTGRPKGVTVSHGALTNFLKAMALQPGLNADDRMAAVTTVSFDIAGLELWQPLRLGAQLELVSEAVAADGLRLRDLLEQRQITVMQATPTTWRLLLAAGWRGNAQFKILCGGEALPEALAQQLSDCGTALWNLYGPTETTIWSTRAAFTPEEGVHIGAAIENTALYVLDAHMAPVPLGAPGELFIGGTGLARGYHARPDLTATAFVPDPFAAQPGARLYRTGDVVAWRHDGALAYLGRADHQVKIRGFRIELADIEAAMETFPAITEAAVLARDEQLVAWFTATQDLAPQALRDFLAAKLPRYMVPNAFKQLPDMPRTPNGKLDRKDLAARQVSGLETAYAAPRNLTEQGLCDIWSEVLGKAKVGIRDNFFDLGGHSLSATRLAVRIRQVFQADLPLRDLFTHPTIEELAPLVADRSDRPGLPPITARDADQEPAPLSFSQKRLWFLDKLEPNAVAYNLSLPLRLRGPLDLDRLTKALTGLVQRQHALRTRVIERDGRPYQQIDPPGEPHLTQVDLSSINADQREAESLSRINAAVLEPFDLYNGPLFRTFLYTLDDQDHVLLFTMHHIIADGWSIQVLLRELMQAYVAPGEPQSAPVLQFADFAQWEHDHLRGETLTQRLDWWHARLADAPPHLDMPADFPRPAVQTFNGNRLIFKLPADHLQRLDHLCKQHGVTRFMALSSVFALLLSRYSGQGDLNIGTPIANRDQPGVENVVGYFANTLVMRFKPAEAVTFADLLAATRQFSLDAFAMQDVPFEQIVERLQPERDMSRSPLFQVMFTLGNPDGAGGDNPSLNGLALEPITFDNPIAKFDLSLALADDNGQLVGSLDYNTDLFRHETAERWTHHFERLLDQLLEAPNQTLSAVSLLDDTERRAILETFNATHVAYDHHRCIHALFEDQAQRHPDGIAVEHGETQITYAALDAAANRLAHELLQRGLTPEARVGVCLERSIELVTALLAVLKAGGAYMPLDPTYPIGRFNYQLTDSGAQLLITRTGLGDREDRDTGADLLMLDRLNLDHHPQDKPKVLVSGQSAAYVIYTSGTTGNPKGVLTIHQNVVNHITGPDLHMTPDEGMAQCATPVFDAYTGEAWSALCHGGRLCIVDRDTAMNPAAFGKLVRDRRIAVALVTAAMLKQYADAVPDLFSTMRWVSTGGDKADAGAVRTILEHGPPEQLWNAYGPTEATCYTLLQPLTGEDTVGDPAVGAPISNTTAYVLDRHMNPVPFGVAGELFIGGYGIARGYHQRPGLTAAALVPHPFAGQFGIEPGARLYRTGDLACLRRTKGPRGAAVHFMGRVDRQVKIRGFRVEPGEVENQLRDLDQVNEALVLVTGSGVEDKHLTAYYTLRDHDDADEEHIRQALAQRVPAFMLPSHLIRLDQFPLNVNAKVDIAALPKPDQANRAQTAYVEPQTPTEKQIASIWAELLELDQVGLNDNFFKLGGHSLMMARIAARLREELDLDLPIKTLFETPTVAELAQYIDVLLWSQDGGADTVEDDDDMDRGLL